MHTLTSIVLPATLIAATTSTDAAISQSSQNKIDVATQCVLIANQTERLNCFDQIFSETQTEESTNTAEVIAATPAVENLYRTPLDLEQSFIASKETRSAQLVLAEKTFPETNIEPPTPLSILYDLDKNSEDGLLSIREHNPMYILPAWYNSNPNYHPHTPTRGYSNNEIQAQQKNLELKGQISFKTKLAEDLFKTRADLWLGYTQQSNWQVYNQGKKSAPFRNTDYTPELFITQPVKANLPHGGKLRMLGAGIVHQSNGQSRPLSRSWNRAYLMAGMEWGKLTVIPRWWLRLDKKDKKDDNPDIGKYMGYSDLKFSYRYNDKQSLSSTFRYNPLHNKGAIQLDYSFLIKGKLQGYIQAFHGYGENLLDYNKKQTGIGFGLMFQGWDGI